MNHTHRLTLMLTLLSALIATMQNTAASWHPILYILGFFILTYNYFNLYKPETPKVAEKKPLTAFTTKNIALSILLALILSGIGYFAYHATLNVNITAFIVIGSAFTIHFLYKITLGNTGEKSASKIGIGTIGLVNALFNGFISTACASICINGISNLFIGKNIISPGINNSSLWVSIILTSFFALGAYNSYSFTSRQIEKMAANIYNIFTSFKQIIKNIKKKHVLGIVCGLGASISLSLTQMNFVSDSLNSWHTSSNLSTILAIATFVFSMIALISILCNTFMEKFDEVTTNKDNNDGILRNLIDKIFKKPVYFILAVIGSFVLAFPKKAIDFKNHLAQSIKTIALSLALLLCYLVIFFASNIGAPPAAITGEIPQPPPSSNHRGNTPAPTQKQQRESEGDQSQSDVDSSSWSNESSSESDTSNSEESRCLIC